MTITRKQAIQILNKFIAIDDPHYWNDIIELWILDNNIELDRDNWPTACDVLKVLGISRNEIKTS